ncbi:MAG: hypothetical protein J6Y78_10060 [Paludibacteraceae bacterium]|nr:hypothetical protein [Paludibacteraceae bacterium]
MAELLKEIMEHYNDMIVAMAEKVEDAEDNEQYYIKQNRENRAKIEDLTKEIGDLSRTISVLKDTLKCHNDFLDNGELREDYDKFQDKWLSEKESNK